MALLNRRTRTPDPRADGLAEIAAWEAWLLAGNRRLMQDDGLDAAAIARIWPAVEAQIRAAATRLREEFLSRTPR